MTSKELIDLIAPQHDRTSCNDNELGNGFYSNSGNTRCGRCSLLQILKEGRLPFSHTGRINFDIDDKLADKELRGEE
jgi:hypothetical protein